MTSFVCFNSAIIPLSWNELNDQMLCKLDEGNQFSDGMHQFLQFLFQIQFTADCNSLNTKFIIYDIALEAKQGFGSSITNRLKRILSISLMLNRTLLITGKYDWSYNLSYCTGFDAMECYFIPISNCNALDILDQINQSDRDQYHFGSIPKHCRFGANDPDGVLPECKERVIHIVDRKTSVYHGMRSHEVLLLNKDINRWTRSRFNLRMMPFEAVVAAFFSRPRPEGDGV